MPIDAGDVVTFAGFVGLILAYQQLRLARRAQQTQLIAQLYQEFTRDERRLAFLYRLEYSGPEKWTFDPPLHDTPEERQLDGLLYFFSFIGTLTRHGDVAKRDLQWLVSELRILMENSEVLKYLAYLRTDDVLPEHVSYANAIHLYGELVGMNRQYQRLKAAYDDGSPRDATRRGRVRHQLLRLLGR
jgi:hypothetical protein